MHQLEFTETQIVSILNEVDVGRPVKEIWRSRGISSAAYYKWNAKDGGLEVFNVKWLKELEQENGRLNRMYADLSLENAALKDVHRKKALGTAERWEVVAHRVSQGGRPVQRAFVAVGLGLATYYRPLMDWARRDAR